MTHHEILEQLPRPETLEPSDCPGLLRLSAYLGPPRAVELWACTVCNWSVEVLVDEDGSKIIRNAFPEPTIPSLKLAEDEVPS